MQDGRREIHTLHRKVDKLAAALGELTTKLALNGEVGAAQHPSNNRDARHS